MSKTCVTSSQTNFQPQKWQLDTKSTHKPKDICKSLPAGRRNIIISNGVSVSLSATFWEDIMRNSWPTKTSSIFLGAFCFALIFLS